MEFVDPHVHFWNITGTDPVHSPVTLGAVAAACPVYGVADLRADVDPYGMKLTGAIHIEAIADDALREVDYVVQLAEQADIPLGIVGYANLADAQAPALVASMMEGNRGKYMRGIRMILNHNPSWPKVEHDEHLTSTEFARGYAELAKHKLSFDLQANPHQLERAAALAAKHPEVPMIVDHLGTLKLNVEGSAQRTEALANWRAGMHLLAAAGPHVYVKLSMLAYTESNWHEGSDATVDDLVHEVIALFGTDRCMLASNYPVDKAEFNVQPAQLWAGFSRLLARYDEAAQRQLLSETARRAYRL